MASLNQNNNKKRNFLTSSWSTIVDAECLRKQTKRKCTNTERHLKSSVAKSKIRKALQSGKNKCVIKCAVIKNKFIQYVHVRTKQF